MVFDRRQSVIFGYHLIKSVASSNIFSFFIGGETADDFDFVLVFFLFFLFFFNA